MALNPQNLERTVVGVLHVVFCVQASFVKTRENGAGVVICIVVFLTFIHSNLLVKREVKRGRNSSIWSLSTVLWNIITCVLFTAYVLDDNNLFVSCILIPPKTVNSFMELVWIIGINDFIIKFIVINLKIVLTLIPNFILPYINRGRYYQLMELSSQIYRQLAPIPPWSQYLIPSLWRSLGHFVAFTALIILYIYVKWFTLKLRLSVWVDSVRYCMGDNRCGKIPSEDQLLLSGGICSICQDAFQSPSQLACHHIFCSACVRRWLDKERTCPMCRAIVHQNNDWKDGGTSFIIQFI